MNTHVHWAQAVAQLQTANAKFVLVTVLAVRGSTPRAAGTKMVVTETELWGSIGGGNLEFQATELARQLLSKPKNYQLVQKLLLSTDLQQCCGGAVTVLLESFVEREATLWLFGAGHVAQSLITILGQLPVRVQWVDNRAELFPECMPLNTTQHAVDDPVLSLTHIQASDDVVIMTHDHDLDYALVEGLLKHPRTGLLGLIGSDTKALRFRQRLDLESGLSDEVIAKLQCPIGLSLVRGKRPMEVAISIAAQLVIYWQTAPSEMPTEPAQPVLAPVANA